MPTIRIQLHIRAPIQTCFDLARSIDVHMQSTSQTRERAIAGCTSGLIGWNETVTWEAVHFGIRQHLTVRITEFDPPHRFVDEMVSGAFKRFYHVHEFMPTDEGTIMTDTFDYTSPFGLIGKLADVLFLKRYMYRFLLKRNLYIKELAERQATGDTHP
jgi:ligand-binding SRPBCC domain-containing protein